MTLSRQLSIAQSTNSSTSKQVFGKPHCISKCTNSVFSLTNEQILFCTSSCTQEAATVCQWRVLPPRVLHTIAPVFQWQLSNASTGEWSLSFYGQMPTSTNCMASPIYPNQQVNSFTEVLSNTVIDDRLLIMSFTSKPHNQVLANILTQDSVLVHSSFKCWP